MSIELFKNFTNNSLIIAIFSCNRFVYLNMTVFGIFKHINKYERNIFITFLQLDQGTPNLEYILNNYKIENIFHLSPIGYPYSFKLLFSYMYAKYVLILEEDWLVVDISNNSFEYSNFLYISMNVLSKTKDIYGLYLRPHPKGNCTLHLNNKINVKYYEVINPWKGTCYTNGASMYKTYYLKKMNYAKSEYQTTLRCTKLKYHIGYIFWNYTKSNSGLEYRFKHIGKNSTKRGICNLSLYCIYSCYILFVEE